MMCFFQFSSPKISKSKMAFRRHFENKLLFFIECYANDFLCVFWYAESNFLLYFGNFLPKYDQSQDKSFIVLKCKA